MKRKYPTICRASWTVLSALACGLAVGTPGCGSAPDSSSNNPQGEGTSGGNHENGAINSAALAVVKEKYPATWAAATSLLVSQIELEGRIIADAKELHRPDMKGPAYFDFALLKKGEHAGHIIASTGGHDSPVVSWNDKSTTRVRSLEQLHAVDLSHARVYMLDFATFVAERPDGSLLTGGAPMTPEAWASAKEFMNRIPAEKKEQLAQSVASEWKRLAKEDHSVPLPPDVRPDTPGACPEWGCGGDPCTPDHPNYPDCSGSNCSGNTWHVRGSDIIDLPAYAQFHAPFANGYCAVGCAPVAFGIIQAWAARQAGYHGDGSAWSHPRMAYAFNALTDAWPMQPAAWDASDMDTDSKSVIMNMRTSLGGFCTSDGAGGVTYAPPYDNVRVRAQQHFNANAIPIQTWSKINSSLSTYATEIANNIGWGIPIEINGWENPYSSGPHSWIVYGQYSGNCGTYYKLALGWGQSHMGEMVVQSSVLNAINGFAGLTGNGVVTFGPSGLSRDHGPITTGAGGAWCLDPSWDPADGVPVVQWQCYGQDNQNWYLERANLSQQGWLIRNRYSGKCLAPAWWASYNGDPAIKWTCNGNDTNLLWKIERKGNRVALKHVGSGKCLDLDNAGGMAGNGKKVQMWDCLNSYNQTFDFAP